MPTLEGKTALVTGAANGIGRAIAIAFAREGANVVCCDINEPSLDSALACAKAVGDATSIICDVSSSAHAQAAVQHTEATYGALHILVNCAAAFVPYGDVTEVREEDWSRSLSVNLTGPFLMSKHAIPLIAQSGGGSVIHVASQLGQVAKAGICWYGAAKAALIQLAKVMAMDHVHQGIRVNTLSPGPIGTDRLVERYGSMELATQNSAKNTLMKRMGEPEEIAAAAVFLASDASSYMTGADLLIDGGYTAW
ncbi:MAG: NAD(P)-dependent dehydrogenase (short-subunit alcohol dehydrogenase family) [Gammaproteobacteria bacterium]|jgi:NAD(P)-dependent dehydrogenase (short-subunit alcohol dehydrogenase family)